VVVRQDWESAHRKAPVTTQKSGREWLDQLHDADPTATAEARYALGSLTAADSDMLSDLIDGTGTADRLTRLWSTIGLVRLGETASVASSRILDLLADPDPAIRAVASQLARFVMGTAALTALMDLARQDSDVHVREEAIRQIGHLRLSETPDALPLLSDLLRDEAVAPVAAISIKCMLFEADELPPQLDLSGIEKALNQAAQQPALAGQAKAALTRLRRLVTHRGTH